MTPPTDALLAGEAPMAAPGQEVREAATASASAPAAPVPAAQALVKPKERYVYLDAMKGVMILWGIPVHACVISESKFFHLVSDISNNVRMEAFFMISGFLSYMLVKRYGAGTIMRKRTIATGIPLLTVALLLNPITNWIILQYQAHKVAVAAPTLIEFFTGHVPAVFYAENTKITWNWHLHIWFLAVLLVLASLSAPIIAVLDWGKTAIRPKLSRLPDWMLLLLVGAVAACSCVAARVGFDVTVKRIDLLTPAHYPLRMIGYYFAFFALGMTMYASPRLLRIFTSYHWIQFAVAGLVLWGVRFFQAAINQGGIDLSFMGLGNPTVEAHPVLKQVATAVTVSGEAYFAVIFATVLFAFFKQFCSGTEGTMRLTPLYWVHLVASSVLLFSMDRLQHLLPPEAGPGVVLAVEGYFFVIVCLVLFGLFERFVKKAGAPMHFVAESAFCVYLFHYLVIYLNAFWLRDWVGIKNDFLLSLLVTLFTTAVTMLIYEYAVSRNTVLKCLFLGKLPKREKASP